MSAHSVAGTPPLSPLAVVGVSCLFPQAPSAAEFWSNIRRGVDAITEIPSTHWRPEAYFDADPKSPDMTYARRGGFLSPIPFDPLEFGIAPSNLEAIDTSQLLGLVAAKRALEDAGYGANGRDFDRGRVGCILGVTGALEMVIPLGARLGHPKWKQALRDAGVPVDVANDVIARIGESYVPWQENSFPGLLGNVVAGRIANRLDLGGTNCVVDAACASSLSAVHLAALELWSGRADMVLTGGIDTFNDIFMYMCFSKTPALSATGDARPFSEAADGTILGEGCGIVVLKRLADAERDGDRIYGLIRGIGTSSDGAGNAVYAPKKEGQIRCLEDAYKTAGVTPDTIELVEAHGTGTKVGDATEIRGLQEVYKATGRKGPWCALGSVKSQIGHTKAAAGAAGLLKALFALQHHVLPPTIKVEKPQAVLLEPDSPFYVNTLPRPWLPPLGGHPRRAAVSAFGFGGSNFHCVLEESPQALVENDWDGDVTLIALSAPTLPELRTQLDHWKSAREWNTVRVQAAESRRSFRAEHEHRLVSVVERGKSDWPEFVATLGSLFEKYAERTSWSTPDGTYYGRGPVAGRLAVLFPGQGSQSVGMLRELACRFPVMQDVLAEADAAFIEAQADPQVSRLSTAIYPPPAFTTDERDQQERALRATQVAQPALGAVSLGALAILEQFGVKPEITGGHSYGELTALCASRRINRSALYRLSMLRGRLMAEAQSVDGGMLAVGAPLSQVEAAIRETAVDLVVANRNSPNQVVLSGRLPEIQRAAELFARRNLRGKQLPVAAAFHSPLVATASERFRPILEEIEFDAAEVPVYANSSATTYPDDPAAARDLLAGQLAKPVEFVDEISNMYAAGARTFLEVGPGSVLTGLVGSILSGRDARALALDASSGKRGGLWDLASTLAQLAVAGHRVDLNAFDPAPPVPELVDATRLRIPLSGANYVKPRTPRPPRAPMSTIAPPPAAAAPVPAARPVSLPPAATVPAPVPVATAAPIASTPLATPVATAAVPAALTVLQKLHEETARLHRQFLEGQEAALQTLASLMRGGAPVASTTAALSPVTVPTVTAPSPSVAPRSSVAATAVSQPSPAPLAVPAPLPPVARIAPPIPAPVPPTPAPVTTPAPVATPFVESGLTTTVLRIVAEKTGYPAEMLKPQMSLDHDLGIDSIKRVEILSALQEALPQLPTVSPEQLQTLHRLSDVIALLGTTAPVASPAPAMASPAVPVSAPTHDLAPTVLRIVAEKTGYPAEMLKPQMSLDHDLGIDSIKRVEILSALQEALPQLPTVSPEQLQTLHRLSDVIALLGTGPVATATLPVAAPVPVVAAPIHSNAAPTNDLAPTVLRIVAEKTGYPAEMLKPQMSLDHDLGIDSIKRVEILSALQEELPQLPTVSPEQLQTLHRLSDVIALLGSGPTVSAAQPAIPSPSLVAPIPPVSNVTAQGLAATVLRVVAEKTGYPAEMLKPQMSLDHDLGIDSIKRVEILSALQEEVPSLPAVSPEQLQTLHRLSDVMALLEPTAAAIPVPAVPVAEVATPAVQIASMPVAVLAPVNSPVVTPVSAEPLIRGEVRVVPIGAGPRTALALPAGGEFWITDDGGTLALAVASALTAAGYRPRIVHLDEPHGHTIAGNLAGLVILAPSSGMTDHRLWCALEWLQLAGPALEQTVVHGQAAIVATVSRLDGACGFNPHLALGDPASGGLAGLTKTVRHEWPRLTCKALDLAPGIDEASFAPILAEELLHDGPVECGLSSAGRVTLAVEAVASRPATATPIAPGELVLVTGGARGVTAAAARAVAAAFRPHLVLVGRSPIPTVEPDWLKPLTTDAEIKQGLMRYAGVNTPRALQQQTQQILAQREIEATLADLRATGAGAEYRSVDVRDISAVCRLVEELQQQSGPIRGLIHGAGVLADQRIEDKTREQFNSVFDTKVVGLRNLLGAIPADQLRLLAAFSSYTGRFGRTGQIDYAIANEVLNKLVQQFQRRHPACRAAAFNWGPWDGGMVQGGLKALFAKEGVGLIPLKAGAELFVRDLQQPSSAATEILVLGPGSSLDPLPKPANAPVTTESAEQQPFEEGRLAYERAVNVARHPYLADHVLGGKAVVPTAIVAEFLAYAAVYRNPGLEFLGFDKLQIHKGVRLATDETVTLQTWTGRTTRAGGRFLIPTRLTTPRGDQLNVHAAADIWLGNTLPEAESARLKIAGSPMPLAGLYERLFHGPHFRGLERIDALSDEGLTVWSRTAGMPIDWSRDPLRATWFADPLALDVALQSLIVWSIWKTGQPCLPCAIGRYRQFRRTFPRAGVQIALKITHQTTHLLKADVEFCDEAGHLVARMEGCENVIDASLTAAFASSRLG